LFKITILKTAVKIDCFYIRIDVINILINKRTHGIDASATATATAININLIFALFEILFVSYS